MEKWRSKFVLRRTKAEILGDILLAPIYHDVCVKPTETEAKLFDILRAEAEDEYRNWKCSHGREKLKIQGSLLALITNLRINANSFYCGESETNVNDVLENCAKVIMIMSELDSHLARDPSHKVVVFSQFTSFLDILQDCTEDEEVMAGVTSYRFDGTMTMRERDTVVKAFKEDTDPSVLFISLMSGGVGLTLSPEVSTVFLCEPYYNPFVEMQAQDRVHRIGQTNQVHVVRFTMENSIEIWVNKLKESKFHLATGLDLVSEEKQVETFNFGDLDLLFEDMVAFNGDEKKKKRGERLEKKMKRREREALRMLTDEDGV
jgi:DNA repair protein RAD5